MRGEDGSYADLTVLQGASLRPYRRAIRMIFQDPYASLNPRKTVLQIVGESLRRHDDVRVRSWNDGSPSCCGGWDCVPSTSVAIRMRSAGGERQRIGVARALALQPRLVIADEAVSALDVSVQAQILNLLQELQAEFDLTYLFVAYELSVVDYISDRVAVMYVGKLVEVGSRARVFATPKHPYTEALLSALPKPDPRLRSAGARIRLSAMWPTRPTRPPAATSIPAAATSRTAAPWRHRRCATWATAIASPATSPRSCSWPASATCRPAINDNLSSDRESL